MRRYTIYLLLSLTLLPISLLHGESEALFSGAPRGDDGRFTNPAGDLTHGTLSVRFPFILRRLGTYFRSADGAPLRSAQ